LIAEGNLKKLCREAEAVLDCVINAFDDSSSECQEEYKRRYKPLTREILGNGEDFLREICEDDVLESATSNLDCILDEKLLDEGQNCIYANRGRGNCSGLHYPSTEETECYREKYRRTCDVDEIVECASNTVDAKCHGDSGELVTLLGNAYFETLKYPVCPDYGELKNLLKYFKK